MRNLIYNKTKMHWKILNGNKQEVINASRGHLFDYFKKINAGNLNSDAESNEEVNNNAQINENLDVRWLFAGYNFDFSTSGFYLVE